MKAMWNGSISFGLVNIPIKLYSAVESKAFSFKMLDKKHHSPIHYKKWCEECGREVEWDEIVKGVEVSKDQYYVVSPEELDKIKPKKTDTIEIVQFVDAREIDPIYFSSHYYAGPAKEKEKTYFLFKEVLELTAKVAIGTFVMHEKEHVCAIEAYKGGLLLTNLNYAYEIRDISKIEELKEPPKLEKEEVELAKQLISKLEQQSLGIEKFKETFSEELRKILKKRAKGEIVTIREEARTVEKEKNLIEALKASLK